MQTGAITGYIDVAQITLYVFWIFFAGLILYLHRENKREGYPLESERSAHITVQGFPAMPAPKTFLLADGSTVTVPTANTGRVDGLAARAAGNFPGAPLVPTGNPMTDGVGPGAYSLRADVTDKTLEGSARIVPLRADAAFGVAAEDIDPRGLPVLGADGAQGGVVTDLWVDRSEMLFRYLEVKTGAGRAERTVLLPMTMAVVGSRAVEVDAILGSQFADVPGTLNPDQVTLLEEEKICAYYAAGTLYATPGRQEPWI